MIAAMDDRDKAIVTALAQNRMRVSEVARVMYMHRNAVDYRIRKIKKETGLDPLDFYDLYVLTQMAGADGNEKTQVVKVVRCEDCAKRKVSAFDGQHFCGPCGSRCEDPLWYCPEGGEGSECVNLSHALTVVARNGGQ